MSTRQHFAPVGQFAAPLHRSATEDCAFGSAGHVAPFAHAYDVGGGGVFIS
jgi:hypothetical protein